MSEKLQLGALESETNKYVLPFNASKDKTYKCVDCSQRVLLRKGTIRRAHFSHYSPTNTCSYYEHPNESQMHKDAKYKLAERLNNKFPITINNFCPKCGIYPTIIDDLQIEYADGDAAVVEYRDPSNKWVADVALVNNGKIRYIFEIKHTHATITNARPEPWFEFTTKEIFEEEERLFKNDPADGLGQEYFLQCTRTSKNRYCDDCRILTYAWVDKLPRLSRRENMTGMWAQEKPCIICKREKYRPVFVRGPRQICKLCLGPSEEKLKAEYSKSVCMIIDE
jgi:hypothetical protein